MSRLSSRMYIRAGLLVWLMITCAGTCGQDAVPARKSADELQSMGWKEIVQYYLQTFEKPNDAVSKAYTDRMRTLLDHQGLMFIQSYCIVDGKRTDGPRLYYRPGELHVVNALGGIDADPGEWNLMVRDGKAYEWRTGDSTGFVSKAVDYDMIAYLCYYTDFAMVFTSMYQEYLEHPKSFHPPERDEANGWKAFRPKEKNEFGIVAVFVGDDPFWIFGIEVDEGDRVVRLLQDRPKPIEHLPDNFFAPLDKFQFEESDLSLRRHLIFL